MFSSLFNFKGCSRSAHNQWIPSSLEILVTQSTNRHLELHFRIHINCPCGSFLCFFSCFSFVSVFLFAFPCYLQETRKTESKCIDFHLEEDGLLKLLDSEGESICVKTLSPKRLLLWRNQQIIKFWQLLKLTLLWLCLNNLFSVWASAWNKIFTTPIRLGCYNE